jgi:hypothetical protein
MWPFTRRKSLDEDIEQAIALAGMQWREFLAAGSTPRDADIRLLVGRFALEFKPTMAQRFSSLAQAPAELVLLIIAQGGIASGEFSRAEFEHGLGIVLPRR